MRKQFPDVMILAHPECSPEVVAKADFSGSTTAMIKAVEKSNAKRYLLLTECSMGDNIVAANPGKEMLQALQPPLPAHERDHARAHARLAALPALGDRGAGGHPRPRAARGRAHARRRAEGRLKAAIHSDVLILGCGIAGGTAALELADAGLDVVIATRAEEPAESNTYWAQGGIIFRGEGDSPELLTQDVLHAGAGICREQAVEILARTGPGPGAVGADRPAPRAVRPPRRTAACRWAARAGTRCRASCTRRTRRDAPSRTR